MNPDEHVWGHLKGIFRRSPLGADENFDEAVKKSRIAANRRLVRTFFHNPEVEYVRAALKWQRPCLCKEEYSASG